MKKISKTLRLNKESIRHISGQDLDVARGGQPIDTWTVPVATAECETQKLSCANLTCTSICDPPPPPP